MRAKKVLQQLSEAYQCVLSEAVNGNDIDLNADPAAQKVQKKAIPLEFRVAEQPETIQTLEGTVEAPAGAYIMTGTKGENWPIPADKFKETYDVVSDTTASKKAIPVQGKQMQEDFFVTVSWSPDKLNGKPGDWLVQYGPGDYGVVESGIFGETYDVLGEDAEEPRIDPLPDEHPLSDKSEKEAREFAERTRKPKHTEDAEETHKPYVSSYKGDDGKKVFDVLDSNGQPVFRTHSKLEAYKWLKTNYENL